MQRCHEAPANTRAIDAFSPACASEITRRTPSRPRSLEAAQERGPEHLVFGVADVDAEHLAVPVDGHRGGHDDGAADDAVVDCGP